jgi:hypothetical protein
VTAKVQLNFAEKSTGESVTCFIKTIKPQIQSAYIKPYRIQEKTENSFVSLKISETTHCFTGIRREPVPLEKLENEMLSSVYPEIIGATIGGIAMLVASFYSFAIGLAGAGYAMLGPSLAGIFGSVALWILNRQTEK